MNTSSVSAASGKAKKPMAGARNAQPLIRVPAAVLDVLAGLILLGVFGWYGWAALQLPASLNPNAIGVGEFPTIIAVAALVSVVLMLCLGVVRCLRHSPQDVTTICRPWSVVLAILILLGIGTYLDKLGPVIGVAALSALLMLAAGERRPLQITAVSLGLSAGLYAIFVLALGVSFS
jgi:hypothetical protein